MDGIDVWGHARSRDLIHWEHLPISVFPDPKKDEFFIWWGCTRINATPRMALLMFFTLISTFPLCYWCVWSAMAGNYFKNRLSIAQSAVFVNYLSGRMAE